MIPKIGILVCGFVDDRQFVTDAYIQAVQDAGGLPLLLPVLMPDRRGVLYASPGRRGVLSAASNRRGSCPAGPGRAPSAALPDLTPYLDLCDAFLLPGGGDFTPLLFGEAPTGQTGETSLDLDICQLRFARSALATGKPVLGICRGMQLLNAALGGTLYQDLSLQEGRPFCHMQRTRRRDEISHSVSVEPGSLLYQIAGDTLYVNSFHHQSVHRPGKQVCVCARASDGTVEAIEVTGHPFALGVQWHPEAMLPYSLEMRKLFYCFAHF